jgi:alpha-glucoside transport system substrate-binding protein
MNPNRRTPVTPTLRGIGLATACAVTLTVGACTGSEPAGDTDRPGRDLAGQTLTVAAVWTGAEQQNFRKVLDAFAHETGATVKFTPTGDNVSTFLDSKIQGGDPPDVAMLPQQGALVQFAKAGHLKPADKRVQQAVDANFSPIWRTLGSVDSTLYGVYFKAANKSTVWYRTKAFEDAGVEPPKTWDEFVTVARAVSDAGTPALAVGGADGWTLTDWFENVYIRLAGPEKYDQLTTHEIPWTDQSVKDTLTELQKVFGDSDNIAGGTNGALQADFPTSVTNVFANLTQPKAATVYEGDFVAGVILDETKAKAQTDFNVYDFPSVNGSDPAVVGGGDMIVMFKDNPAAKALVEYLATPEAATIWVKRGGFSSPNKSVNSDDYPDEILKATATALANAEPFRFDLSDLQPSRFGGDEMFSILQDFLKNPDSVDQTADKLEAAAKRAYGS